MVVDSIHGRRWETRISWDAIGAVAELLGAIGVIATLLYVSRQIRESSKAQRTATQHAVLAEFRAGVNQIMQDPDLFEGFRIFSEGQQVPHDYRLKVAMHIGNQFRIYEELYLAYLDGNVASEFWEPRERTMVDVYLRHELARRWWTRTGTAMHSRPFVDLVDSLIAGADKAN